MQINVKQISETHLFIQQCLGKLVTHSNKIILLISIVGKRNADKHTIIYFWFSLFVLSIWAIQINFHSNENVIVSTCQKYSQ